MTKMYNSKKRVLTAFARQEPDRVPINYFANPGIDLKIKKHFCLNGEDDEGLLVALGVDFRNIVSPYIGPKLHEDVPGRQIDIWGVHKRRIEHKTGGYWDYCDFPLKNASPEDVEEWPMPSPDDFDYSGIAEQCERMKEYCIVAGGTGTGDIINKAGMVRTMEQVLIDLMLDDPVLLRHTDRRIDVQLEVIHRTLEAANGGIDLLWIGEDLGTQIGPLISIKLFRKHIRPRLQEFVGLAKLYNIPVMIHSCGSSSWAFDDFIEMGISIIDTLQPEPRDMAPEYLKNHFGNRLSFHGCISTAGPVAGGTVRETVENVQKTLEIMMPGGGYAMAPTHLLQDNSHVENVVAMYEAARNYGRY